MTSQMPPASGGDEFGNMSPYAGGGNVPPYAGGGNIPPYAGGGNMPPYAEFGNVPPYAGSPAAPPRNGLSITAMVLGIIAIPGALLTAGVLGVLCGILAIVFGLIGIRQANRGLSDRKGFAVSGLVTGIVGLVLGVVVLAFVIWAATRAQACEDRIGHPPSRSEMDQCIREGI